MSKQRIERILVSANCKTDDGVYDEPFDATRWFEQASDESIAELANSGTTGFGGSEIADRVAVASERKTNGLPRLFQYIEESIEACRDVGFECTIDRHDALRWIAQNKPHLLVVSLPTAADHPAQIQ